jgi:hypothetical protein
MPRPSITQQEVSSFTQNVAAAQEVVSDSRQRVSVSVIPTSITAQSIPSFGKYGSGNLNPSDSVLLDVYSYTSVYQESNYNVVKYSRLDSDTLLFDVIEDLEGLGYINGKFKIQYRLLRNLLGTGDGQKLGIAEISSDRLEVRITPIQSASSYYLNFKNFFQSGVFALDKSEILPALKLFKDSQNSYDVYDFIQDKITYPFAPYSIILKFNNPLPDGVRVGDTAFLAQEITTSQLEDVLVLPKTTQAPTRELKGPNFDAASYYTSNPTTPFKNYAELSGSQSIESNLLAATLSSSLIESIPLNIDYRSFDNFVFFGSAYERLVNFQYKVQLLEGYNSRLSQLTTDLSGLASSSVTGSTSFLNNIAATQNKVNSLIGGFDGYEKYLYFGSSSYESSSYGEFYPTTWPKQTSTKPYTLYSYTSSQAEDWVAGILSSASLYDDGNEYSLVKTVPEHIRLDEANDGYMLFTNMIGHYFDLIYAYVKQINYTHDRQELISDGFAKDIIFNVGESLGIGFDNGLKSADLWNYVLGTNETGSYLYTNQTSLQDSQYEIWKRIINNLPYILKTKGTERGLRSLINIFGIPSTMLRIREYGGPEATYDSVSDYIYDRFYYALNLGMPSASSYAKIEVPWTNLNQTSTVPQAIELRFKVASGSTGNYTIFENPNWFSVYSEYISSVSQSIKFKLSGSTGYLSASINTQVYNDGFWSLLLNKQTQYYNSNYSSSYTLTLQQVNYDKITQAYSASIIISSSISASFDTSFATTGTLYIGGSGSNYFTGSVQELRYWTAPLSGSVFDQHTLAPTSYVGNIVSTDSLHTSSYYTLGARFCFGSDNKRYDLYATTSLASQHPNQKTNTGISASFKNYRSGSNLSSSYTAIVESNTLYWPDLSGNRQISNKIRLQDNELIKPILDRNVKLEIASNETYPIDSPRLGLYFSPQDEVNQDIAEQFSSLNIDNLIGNPGDLERDNYPSLNLIQTEYNKKYTGRNRIGDYLNRVKQIDNSLFKLAQQLVPVRANFQTGIVIEPTILQRSKLPMKQPDWEDLTYSGSINTTETTTISSLIQDMAGDSLAEGYYLFDTTITTPTVTPTASFDQITGSIDTNIVQISMYANQYNDEQTYTALVGGTFPEATIDLFDEGSSQYTFIETVYSGSQWTSSLNPYWRREALQPVILDARLSEIFSISEFTYILNVPTFASYSDINAVGASLDMTFTNFTLLPGGTGLTTDSYLVGFGSASLSHSLDIAGDVWGYTNNYSVLFSYIKSNATSQTISASFYSSGSLVYSNSFIDAAAGAANRMVQFNTPLITADTFELKVANNSAFATVFTLNSININIGSEPARIQDYHFLYEGKVRQLYKGTQQTSQDYNIDSNDTVDKGPVILVQEVNPNTLRQTNDRTLGNSNLNVD